MNFLAPTFLWLLPLASIPIIIHILNQMNIQTVEFSSIKFLRLIEHDSIKKLKLLQLILLIIRTIMILLIILMISRPVIHGIYQHWIEDPNSTFTVIMVDNSFSNSGESNSQPRIDMINSSLSRILEQIHKDSHIVLSTTTAGVIYSGKRNNLPDGLRTIQQSYLEGELSFNFIQSLEYKSREFANYELYLLSDCQNNTFTNIESINDTLEDWNIYIIKPPIQNANYGILDVEIENDFLLTNTPINIVVSVSNMATETIENVLMELLIDDINVGQQLITISSGESANYRFITALPERGMYIGQIKLQNDERIGDNTHYFVINIQEEIKVMSYNMNNIYFNQAIKAIKQKKTDIQNFQFNDNEFRTVDKDVIIIQGEPNNITQHINILKLFVEGGGHIIYFPDKNTKYIPDFIAQLTGDNFKEEKVESASTLFQTISRKSPGIHYFLNQNQNDQIDNIQYFKYIPLQNTSSSQIELLNNVSIWNRYNRLNGIIDVFGFSLDLSWTTLPLRGSFIPFTNNLLHSSLNTNSKKYFTGENWKFSLDSKYFNTALHYISPNGSKDIITSETKYISLLEPGIHRILSNNEPISEIPVNISENELRSPYLTDSEMESLFPNKIVILDDNFAEGIKQARYGTEIWSYLLLFLVLLTCFEMILSNGKRFQNS